MSSGQLIQYYSDAIKMAEKHRLERIRLTLRSLQVEALRNHTFHVTSKQIAKAMAATGGN